MGKKLDALLGRKFKSSKLCALAKLAITRIGILKNQRLVRCSYAKSDVIQLLKLGHQDRALLRLEHVIKDQNMVDAFVMMQDYCHILMERVSLLDKSKECPDELMETASSLIFASSRCGEFPELQEIRAVLVTGLGKEFAAQAVELQNNCRVNPKIIQKLSARQPSLESRKKLLKEIASENGIILHLEEDTPVVAEENLDASQAKQHQLPEEESNSVKLGVTESQDKTQTHIFPEELYPEERPSESLKPRAKYRDVADAAIEAFESAAYAAQAAKAAVELSRYESQDIEQDNHGDFSHEHLSLYDPGDKIVMEIKGTMHLEELDGSKTELEFDRMPSTSSSDSNGNAWSEREQLSDSLSRNKPLGNPRVSYLVDKKAEREQERILSSNHYDLESHQKYDFLTEENQHIRQYNAVHEEATSDEDESKLPQQSPKWIPRESHADIMLNPTAGRYQFKTIDSKSSVQKMSSRSSLEGKHLSVRTRRAK